MKRILLIALAALLLASILASCTRTVLIAPGGKETRETEEKRTGTNEKKTEEPQQTEEPKQTEGPKETGEPKETAGKDVILEKPEALFRENWVNFYAEYLILFNGTPMHEYLSYFADEYAEEVDCDFVLLVEEEDDDLENYYFVSGNTIEALWSRADLDELYDYVGENAKTAEQCRAEVERYLTILQHFYRSDEVIEDVRFRKLDDVYNENFGNVYRYESLDPLDGSAVTELCVSKEGFLVQLVQKGQTTFELLDVYYETEEDLAS